MQDYCNSEMECYVLTIISPSSQLGPGRIRLVSARSGPAPSVPVTGGAASAVAAAGEQSACVLSKW